MSKKQRINLTNLDANNSNAAIGRLASIITDVILGFRIAKNIKPIAEAADEYMTAYHKILQANGAKVEGDRYVMKDGNPVCETAEGQKKANEELSQLAAFENEIEFYPIPLSALANGISNSNTLTVPLFVPLQWMIVDDIEDDDEVID